MALIKLSEYATRHGLSLDAVKSMADRGRFKTLTAKGRLRFVDEDEPYPAGVVPIEDGVSDETLCAIGRAYRVLRKALGWDGRPLDENKIRRPWMGLMELVNAAHINRVVTAEIDEMLSDVLALADPATLDISIPISRRGAWWKGYYSI